MADESVSDLGRAVRWGFVVFGSVFAFFAIRLAFSISGFEAMYADMLTGRPLPMMTAWAIKGRLVWMTLSIALPVAALAFALVPRRHTTSIVGISISAAGLFIQSFLLWAALWSPLIGVIRSLSAND